jgi:hypothetical protein
MKIDLDEPCCFNCIHWRPKDYVRSASFSKRRCVRWPNFTSEPRYVCRVFEIKPPAPESKG